MNTLIITMVPNPQGPEKRVQNIVTFKRDSYLQQQNSQEDQHFLKTLKRINTAPSLILSGFFSIRNHLYLIKDQSQAWCTCLPRHKHSPESTSPPGEENTFLSLSYPTLHYVWSAPFCTVTNTCSSTLKTLFPYITSLYNYIQQSNSNLKLTQTEAIS